LRQDPDIVMVGEIRDRETAEISVQASLTGHLVLSTLHTNTATGAITRLRDMGVEPFLLASSLVGVIAQRLLRKLCPLCKKPAQVPAHDLSGLGYQAAPEEWVDIFLPEGCEHCKHTGFKGRAGIFELIEIDATLRNMINGQAQEHEMEQHARRSSQSIQHSALQKVLAGDTSPDEAIRITQKD
jgi:general secretion pathway protein E